VLSVKARVHNYFIELLVKVIVMVWCVLLRYGWGRKLELRNLTSYQLYRLDHNRHGGGVLIYIHKDYSLKLSFQAPLNQNFYSFVIAEIAIVLILTHLALLALSCKH